MGYTTKKKTIYPLLDTCLTLLPKPSPKMLKDGATPLHLVCGIYSYRRYSRNEAIVKTLIFSGADINSTDSRGRSSLTIAQSYGCSEMIVKIAASFASFVERRLFVLLVGSTRILMTVERQQQDALLRFDADRRHQLELLLRVTFSLHLIPVEEGDRALDLIKRILWYPYTAKRIMSYL